MEKRIVITGVGTLNSIANNVADFAVALQAGVCGIKELDLFDTAEFRTHKGGQIKNFSPRDYINQEWSIKRMSRADMISFAATLEALSDAGLDPLTDSQKVEMGVAIGGGSGGLLEAESFYMELLKKGSAKAQFSKLSTIYCASSADRIASELGLSGPKTTFMTACSCLLYTSDAADE